MKETVILCVDDEGIVLRSLRRELNDALGDEYLIETAEGGTDALEIFRELLAEGHEIPLVISDHIMPDMKGDELLKRIHEIAPKTLKIMLTGQADLEAVTNAVNYASLYRYIAKPWEKTDFILTVKEALRRYEQDKQLEGQNRILQNINIILEQQVKERTTELESQKIELKEANASKDKFFSIIAHDLKSPFTGLLGLIQIFLENLDDFSQDEIKESLDSLQTTAKTVYALIENLLTWSRLQRGVIEHFPREQPINSLVEHNFSLFKANADQKQIRLRNQISPNIIVYADQNMINTVFRNLLSNALKFTQPDGSIEVAAKHHDTHIEVAISDTGIGIDKENMAKLFRIDMKYTNVGTAGEMGTGLGLILCKELIEKNNGKIWVESEVGKGTTFRFTLPKPPF